MASWEGPIKLLLAKVKNASGRIGIFQIGVSCKVTSSIKHRDEVVISETSGLRTGECFGSGDQEILCIGYDTMTISYFILREG